MPEAIAGIAILIWIAGIILYVMWIILPFKVFAMRKDLRKIVEILERQRGEVDSSSQITPPMSESEKEREVQRILEEKMRHRNQVL